MKNTTVITLACLLFFAHPAYSASVESSLLLHVAESGTSAQQETAIATLGLLSVYDASAAYSLAKLHVHKDDVIAELAREATRNAGASITPYLSVALSSPDKTIRHGAAIALTNLGPQAVSAVPYLIPVITGQENSLSVLSANALASIGEPAVPHLTYLLTNSDADTRSLAAAALGQMGEEARGAVPALARCLSSDAAIAGQCAQALAHVGPAAVPVLPELLDAYENSRYELRKTILKSLASLGPAAADGADILLKYIVYVDDTEQELMMQALGRMGPRALVKVEAMLHLDDPAMRAIAADTLAHFGPGALTILTRAMSHPDPQVRWRAAYGLRMLGHEALSALPVLDVGLSDPDHSVRIESAFAIASFGNDASESIPLIMDLLNDSNDYVRAAACHALATLGKHASIAISPMAELARKDESLQVRKAALEAVSSLQIIR